MPSAFLATLLALLPLAASAQSPTPAQTSTPVPQAIPATGDTAEAASPLEPFIASYVVYKDAKPLGEATMQLVRQQPPRWRVDLVMHGTRGLMGFAGLNAEQSSVFDQIGDTYRPLTQATVNKLLFKRKQTVGIYDWAAGEVNWQGDVKESHRRPIALQAGDMTGLLINLAVIRDAAPGQTLHYRFVDDGRMREHTYVVADELESITVAGMTYNAMKATRSKDNEDTVIWVVKNVPSPIRMLKRESGKDVYDLRLVEYKGVD
ncbi:MAG TPA: DUF3108 domain-containing protein [Lysobacter sp.]|nr:DUF3108 domain-containing protein [Lysobacter sp.]